MGKSAAYGSGSIATLCLLAAFLFGCSENEKQVPGPEPEPMKFESIRMLTHKCINHAGDTAYDCDAVKPDSSKDTAYVSDRLRFFSLMADWKTPAGDSLQGRRDLNPSEELNLFSKAGGSPLALEAVYHSPTWRTDRLTAILNGKYPLLKPGVDYGFENDTVAQTTVVRLPLTCLSHALDEGPERAQAHRVFESCLDENANYVGLEAAKGSRKARFVFIIHYDKFGPPFTLRVDSFPRLNRHIFQYQGAAESQGRPGISSKGLLFGFTTSRMPDFGDSTLDAVRIEWFRTDDQGNRERDPWKTYLLDSASLPLPGRSLPPDPFSADAKTGRVYLSTRDGLYDFYAWIPPEDLIAGRGGSLEGRHLADVIVRKRPSNSEMVGNSSRMRLDFTIDNTAPAATPAKQP